MDIRERLRLLKAAGTKRPAAPGTTPSGEPGAPGAPSSPPGATAPPAEGAPSGDAATDQSGPRRALAGGAIPGYLTVAPSGDAFYVETEYPVEYERGPLALEAIFDVPQPAWELLGGPPFNPRRAVYLDTETTGLGGMGTYLFLIGIGFFDAHRFVVRQYFMRDYPDEPAMLEALHADLSRFEAIVSFNGRSFDWPMLEGRFLLHRMRPPLRGAPHFDLLHPARRLWKERLGACNLTNLEEQILNVRRYGDVPGELIPALYFEYLRSGDARPLEPVLHHNLLDIVTMVGLGAVMASVVSDPLSPSPDGELVCGDDLFAVARLLGRQGDTAQSLLCMEAALQRGLQGVGETRALRELSQTYKRIREHNRAVEIWQAMLEREPNLALFPLVELAKYHEHVAKDPETALQFTYRALEIAKRRRSMAGVYGPAAAREVAEIEHRLQRLARKTGSGAT